VTGYEALARFTGPPQMSPDRWFAAAHAAGLGEALEAHALREALRARSALPANCFLTVNVGPDALLAYAVQRVLAAEGDLRGLVIEITEQAPVEDYGRLLAALEPLRGMGALVAIDDAGAGFSSLKHVTTLRPDFVKVDRGLVAGIDADETKGAVVETLGIFASRVDAWLIAEGIETDAELERLIALGVPLAQGYRLGRPAPAMSSLEPGVAGLIRRRAADAASSALLRIAETGTVAPATASHAAVANLFLLHPETDWIVVLDEFSRPHELVRRAGTARIAPLTAMATDRLQDVARRVATRPRDERFAPIAVCDELGRLEGLVRIEHLLQALADVADGEEPAAGRVSPARGTGRPAGAA
jgi:EAL domain-containing protein (putative c-di-GMP-specific phosphodiesterase class I)